VSDARPNYEDSLFSSDSVLEQVKLLRVVVEDAAGGSEEAARWLASRWSPLARLLGQVEAALTARN
jgi:hypothetical protein